MVKPNDKVDVKILRVATADRKIGLSLKRAKWGAAQEEKAMDSGASEPRMDMPSRGGMDDHGALGTDKIEF